MRPGGPPTAGGGAPGHDRRRHEPVVVARRAPHRLRGPRCALHHQRRRPGRHAPQGRRHRRPVLHARVVARRRIDRIRAHPLERPLGDRRHRTRRQRGARDRHRPERLASGGSARMVSGWVAPVLRGGRVRAGLQCQPAVPDQVGLANGRHAGALQPEPEHQRVRPGAVAGRQADCLHALRRPDVRQRSHLRGEHRRQRSPRPVERRPLRQRAGLAAHGSADQLASGHRRQPHEQPASSPPPTALSTVRRPPRSSSSAATSGARPASRSRRRRWPHPHR